MVYQNVISYCAENNISISAFEKMCSLPNGLVAKWKEKGYEPSIPTLQKISSATKVPIEKWVE